MSKLKQLITKLKNNQSATVVAIDEVIAELVRLGTRVALGASDDAKLIRKRVKKCLRLARAVSYAMEHELLCEEDISTNLNDILNGLVVISDSCTELQKTVVQTTARASSLDELAYAVSQVDAQNKPEEVEDAGYEAELKKIQHYETLVSKLPKVTTKPSILVKSPVVLIAPYSAVKDKLDQITFLKVNELVRYALLEDQVLLGIPVTKDKSINVTKALRDRGERYGKKWAVISDDPVNYGSIEYYWIAYEYVASSIQSIFGKNVANWQLPIDIEKRTVRDQSKIGIEEIRKVFNMAFFDHSAQEIATKTGISLKNVSRLLDGTLMGAQTLNYRKQLEDLRRQGK